MSRVWDVPVHDTTRIRDVRVATEAACAHAGLDARRTAAAALVSTELATNLLRHAGGGHMVINLVAPSDTAVDAAEKWVQIISLDHGPGIGDVEMALSDGFTTLPTSLGAGLGTCLRLANDFDLYSRPGHGTVGAARIGPAPTAHRAISPGRHTAERAGGINVSLALAEHSGDAFTWVRSGTRLTMMLADGLGHGAKAAQASITAVEQLQRTADLAPGEILRHLDAALRSTRGAAVAIGQLDETTGMFTFSGVGNVGARMRVEDSWQPLLSHPGIVGAHFPARPPVQRMPWRRDSLFILHSDGLPSRWTPPTDPRLLDHDPAVIAATILRDAGSAARPLRDDTSVAVLVPDRRTDPHAST
jgi:anti-sigma regulatory factor (Ser/Thr protein kinase)